MDEGVPVDRHHHRVSHPCTLAQPGDNCAATTPREESHELDLNAELNDHQMTTRGLLRSAYICAVPDPTRRQKMSLEWRRFRRRLRYTRPGDWWTAIGVICFALAVIAIVIGALWASNR
jgi:hypothetical protein